jgi:aminopeptidase N
MKLRATPFCDLPFLRFLLRTFCLLAALMGVTPCVHAYPAQAAAPTPAKAATAQQAAMPTSSPTRADILLGAYGPYRANNDLLYYHLDVRVDPERKCISGKNTIRFRMLKSDTRIQIDLHPSLRVDKILFGATSLKYERDFSAVFIDFPQRLAKGHVYSIEFFYSGNPLELGWDRGDKISLGGGIGFSKDASGHDWINTVCEGVGSSTWWPSKDQWRDEVENMDISVEIPNSLVDVSNGEFQGKTDLGDGYTRWDWHVHYPINNYDVSLNIGDYVHFSDRLGDLPLDFYVLPENLDKAKQQFGQVKGMLETYQHYFGEYPFKKDGYKLIEAPMTGMEHQSAVTYGNRFENGYLGRDWTGVGISPRFDFIIVHESAHEWFGNAITAADHSDMWIHEAWATYLESLYVEYRWGKADGIKYVNGYKPKVKNDLPIVAERGVNATPPVDQYFKGMLFINTLRSIVNDDDRWWKLLHDFYQHFEYKNIMTEDVVAYFNQSTGMDLTPIFNQYLRRTAIPTLDLKFDESAGTVAYRWKVDEPAFVMPVRVGREGSWQIIEGTTQRKTMSTSLKKDDFEVATDLYYVNVSKQ